VGPSGKTGWAPGHCHIPHEGPNRLMWPRNLLPLTRHVNTRHCSVHVRWAAVDGRLKIGPMWYALL
jgi:hypothetical protein